MMRWANGTMLRALLLDLVGLVCLGAISLADAPVLANLEVVSIKSASLGAAWTVELSVNVSHQPLAAVSNLTTGVYDELGNLVVQEVDHAFYPNLGDSVDDYFLSIEIPKGASGYLVIEVCAKHGNDWGCTRWQGWVPQKPSFRFLGGLVLLQGSRAVDVGEFESAPWVLTAHAAGNATVILDTRDCRLACGGRVCEIPVWWRVWDSFSDCDGLLEYGEVVDTGWVPGPEFLAHWNLYEVQLPPGWTGEIRFQLKLERRGIVDRAGKYFAILRVEVSDGD